jgi:cytochrome c oxidase cbb3-type subunit I/II
MENPYSTSPGSIMPPYAWMLKRKVNTDDLPAKIRVLQLLGTPYPEGFDQEALADLQQQAATIADGLRTNGVEDEELEERQIVALIAYLQRLGTDIKAAPQPTTQK